MRHMTVREFAKKSYVVQSIWVSFYFYYSIHSVWISKRRGTKHTYAEAEPNSLIQSAIAFHEEIYP